MYHLNVLENRKRHFIEKEVKSNYFLENSKFKKSQVKSSIQELTIELYYQLKNLFNIRIQLFYKF